MVITNLRWCCALSVCISLTTLNTFAWRICVWQFAPKLPNICWHTINDDWYRFKKQTKFQVLYDRISFSHKGIQALWATAQKWADDNNSCFRYRATGVVNMVVDNMNHSVNSGLLLNQLTSATTFCVFYFPSTRNQYPSGDRSTVNWV